jgi:hypothetical protein
VRRPVEGAKECSRRHSGVGAAAARRGDERPDAALVAIALGDNPLAQTGRQRVHCQVRGRAFHLVDQTQHVSDRQAAEADGERSRIFPRGGKRREQTVQRPVLAEEEQLLLAAEVVVQVAGGEVGGDGDVAHAGGGEPAGAEHPCGGAHDLHTAGVGSFRTAVRKMNHGSILPEAAPFLAEPTP